MKMELPPLICWLKGYILPTCVPNFDFTKLCGFRDRYIEHLLHQVEQLSTELHEARSECQRKIEDMKQSLEELAARLSEKEVEVELALQGKEDIERKLKEAASSAHHGSLVQLQLQV